MEVMMEKCIRCTNVECVTCDGQGCEVRSALPASPWAQGTEHPGAWCDTCVALLVTKIEESGHKMSGASLVFLKTIAQAPEEYVRDTPASAYPYRTIDMLKKQRTKFMNKLAWDTFGMKGSPFAFDQINYEAPYPYFTTTEIANVINRLIDDEPDDFAVL